jgi:glycosyltransferase involved in cell wall biosynthesis
MHILYICNEYPPASGVGGVGIFTRTLARALANTGFQVGVIGLYPPDQSGIFTDNGVSVIRLPRFQLPRINGWLNSFLLSSAISRLDQKSRIDIIEGPEMSQAYIGGAKQAKRIIRLNGGHHFFRYTLGKKKPLFWRGLWERWSFSRAEALCAVSRFVAEMTRRLLNLGDIEIPILPNPVNADVFRPMPDIPETDGAILFIGTLCEKKGIRQLVQAMPEIAAHVPHAQLWAAGRDTLNPRTGHSFIADLQNDIPDKLREKVTFLGPIPNEDLPRLIARAQVCVYPSHMEAMPIACLEGLACGKAVVFSQTGPGPELIDDEQDGLLCDPYDPQSIASQVVRLLADVELRRKLGSQARQKALQQFSLDVLLKRNIEFYQKCLV